MRVVVVGYGVQGKKRRRVAGTDFVGIVDPVAADADWRDIAAVPLDRYDAALVCTPDEPKIEILSYLLGNGKHALVEKPLHAANEGELDALERTARATGAVCYTAYNHRFEPHYVRMRDLVKSGVLGDIYRCRMFYGNGTARLVRDSAWRDQGAGVLPDLGSHLLDTARFWFGDIGDDFRLVSVSRFENRAPDHVVFVATCAAAATRIRNDAAVVSQSFHLRRARRKRHRAHRIVVQMGADDLHPSLPGVAERPAAGTSDHLGAGGSDLGVGIRPLQVAGRREGERPI